MKKEGKDENNIFRATWLCKDINLIYWSGCLRGDDGY